MSKAPVNDKQEKETDKKGCTGLKGRVRLSFNVRVLKTEQEASATSRLEAGLERSKGQAR
jgi:hypothetical protein